VSVVYRWAANSIDRLPEMAAELVRRQAAVIVTTGGPTTAVAAKAATETIPIVFLVGEDSVRLGLVSSLARPSGNLTGINLLTNELEAKRLELLHQLVPRATRIAVLVNPADVRNTETTLREVGAAAPSMGRSRFSGQARLVRSRKPSRRSARTAPMRCSWDPPLS
jgi:putative ABC transport system substrate-binding protein